MPRQAVHRAIASRTHGACTQAHQPRFVSWQYRGTCPSVRESSLMPSVLHRRRRSQAKASTNESPQGVFILHTHQRLDAFPGRI
jgi:hypothetical protein